MSKVSKKFVEGRWRHLQEDGSLGAECGAPTEEEQLAMVKEEQHRRYVAQAEATGKFVPLASATGTPAAGALLLPRARPWPEESKFPDLLTGLAIASLVAGGIGLALGLANSNAVEGFVILGAGAGTAVTLRAMALGMRWLLDVRNMAVSGRTFGEPQP